MGLRLGGAPTITESTRSATSDSTPEQRRSPPSSGLHCHRLALARCCRRARRREGHRCAHDVGAHRSRARLERYRIAGARTPPGLDLQGTQVSKSGSPTCTSAGGPVHRLSTRNPASAGSRAPGSCRRSSLRSPVTSSCSTGMRCCTSRMSGRTDAPPPNGRDSSLDAQTTSASSPREEWEDSPEGTRKPRPTSGGITMTPTARAGDHPISGVSVEGASGLSDAGGLDLHYNSDIPRNPLGYGAMNNDHHRTSTTFGTSSREVDPLADGGRRNDQPDGTLWTTDISGL